MLFDGKYVAGIDISKNTFDLTVTTHEGVNKHHVFDNDLKGFHAMGRWLKEHNISLVDTLFCMENTGIYHRSLASFLLKKNAKVWVETAAQIKWSLGIQRGKNDKADSLRIMDYARRNLDKVKYYEKRGDNLQQIADLVSVRKRLISCHKGLKTPIGELRKAGLKEQAMAVEKSCKRSLETLQIEIKSVEKTIKKLIADSPQLKELYGYITSVKSIGFVAACQLIVYTEGFTKFKSAKQIASYCGIAPFEYSSGISIKGRTRVHHMANKELKTVLHMCAISSVANNDEMKNYFNRKVEEGKNKMLILNNIRNKLISRVFSCVKNRKMYEPFITT